MLKKRPKDEGNETVINCNDLRFNTKDGKYRITDVVDIEIAFADLGELTTREIAKKKTDG